MRFYLKIPLYIPDILCRIAVRPVLIYRRFKYGYPFRKIRLTNGNFAIVDGDDFTKLSKFKWHSHRCGRAYYAFRHASVPNCNKRTIILMHRQIMNSPPDKAVDHINHNGLDNRKANLRIVSRMQNQWNMRKQQTNCTSRYKGIYFYKRYKKWSASIRHNGTHIFLGNFDDEETAARAYDAKARELFGQYACLNFPSNSSENNKY